MRNTILLSLALVGCGNEYDIVNSNAGLGRYNPPNLAAVTQEDVIVQVTIPSVDVLWVIDDSCSMAEEQASLTSNFGAFMTYFVESGLDYHVGVVSTDMMATSHKGKLETHNGTTYIDNTFTQEEAVQSFSQRAKLGTMGSADEKGIEAAYTALTSLSTTYNAGFYREEAALSVIVISDEDDYSSRGVQQEMLSWLGEAKPDLEMVSFSSIVGPDLGNGRTCSSAIEPGAAYINITNTVGGIEWGICNSDWSSVLTELGLQAAGLKREFFLSQVPVEESINVMVIDTEGTEWGFAPEDDYVYSRARNSITFNSFIPDPLSEIIIDYEVLADSTYELDEGDTAEEGDTGE